MRDAFKSRLEGCGLLDGKANIGVSRGYLSDRKSYLEIFVCVKSLEGMGLHLAAQNMSSEQIAELKINSY